MEVAETYLQGGKEKSSVSVIGGEETLRQANASLGDKALKIERI